MEESKQDDVEDRPVDETTCWECLLLQSDKVAMFCKGLLGSRFAMFCYCLLAFLPVVDILSDLLTAADFANNGHPWWAATTLGIVYLSGRFTVLFMVVCPFPSAKNLLRVYLPLCWIPALHRVDRWHRWPSGAEEPRQASSFMYVFGVGRSDG